jgi:hypothetical protein
MFRLLLCLAANAGFKVGGVLDSCLAKWLSFSQWTCKIFWLCSQLNVIG